MKTKLTNIKFILPPLLLVIFSFLIIPNSKAAAAQVSFVVEGYLEHVDAELAGIFSIGDLYHLEYTFESTTVDSVPGDPTLGVYDNAISSLSVNIGDYYYATGNGRSKISVSDNTLYIDGNNSHSYIDEYRIDLIDPMSGDSVNGNDLDTFQAPLFSLIDLSGNAFSNDELITYVLDPSDFIGYMALAFYNPISGTTVIQSNISSFQVSSVPVPSAFWLLLPGLISLFGISRFKK